MTWLALAALMAGVLAGGLFLAAAAAVVPPFRQVLDYLFGPLP